MADLGSFKEVGYIAGSLVAGAIASVVGLRKVARGWQRDGLEIQKTSAEESLIGSLRQESERMATQNQKLMEQLSHLQLQIGDLHQSINKLRLENDSLHRQISQLHTELNVRLDNKHG